MKNETIALVIAWATQREIFSKGNPNKQAFKTLEECGELLQAIAVNNKREIKDAIGDILVTLIIQCEMQGLTLQECLESAYNEISERKGEMLNGTFIKL